MGFGAPLTTSASLAKSLKKVNLKRGIHWGGYQTTVTTPEHLSASCWRHPGMPPMNLERETGLERDVRWPLVHVE